VFANFVTTLDGIVSYGLPGRTEARFISAGHPADRFVLGLLRAVADAVVVGAGTLRGEPGVTWSPEAVFPEASDAFRQLRSAMRKPARPLTVITTRSGKIDLNAPAVTEGAPLVILTSAAGAARLGGVPPHVRVRMLESGDAAEIVAMAAAESGGRSILTEGGPTLFGQFLREGAVDEIGRASCRERV